MGKFIRSQINIDIEEKAWNEFLAKFDRALSAKKSGEILDSVLSSEEKIVLARRAAIIILLGENKTYREVSRLLGVSHQTISSVKKSISEKSYKPYRQKLKIIKSSPEKSIFYEIGKILSKMPTYTGKGRWRYLNID